jgi:tRNA threonylcarbamoyladenosine biosynthesis protein TsaE
MKKSLNTSPNPSLKEGKQKGINPLNKGGFKSVILTSEQDTKNFAKEFAKNLQGGQTLGLVGQLGAGKTFFTKAIGKALGITETIKSPSFNLLKIYSIKFPSFKEGLGEVKQIKTIVHIDCYRLNNSDELIEIGFLDYLNSPNTLVIVEWADKVKNILPKNTVWLKFEIGENETRVINFSK